MGTEKQNSEELKKKQEAQARVLYIVLASMLAVIMIISVITAISKRNSKKPVPLDTQAAETTVGKIETRPAQTLPAPVVRPPVQTDAPVTAPPETTGAEQPVSNPRVYVMPTQGYVMKDFSVDMPVYSVTMNDYRAHKGVDISAEVGAPVYAFTDGVIKDVYADPMMGYTVQIDHGDGLVSYYQNLHEEVPDGIKAGAKVEAGDLIGAIGETTLTELSEAAHLHFEIHRDGTAISPTEYLSTLKQTSAEE